MNIKKLNEELDKYLNLFPINEMAITRANSGILLFPEPQNIETIIEKCYQIYTNKQNITGYADVSNLLLNCTLPWNNQKIKEPITIVYGNKNIGIFHIFQQRSAEFSDPNKCKTRLNEKQVKDYLLDLEDVVTKGTVLIDFNLKEGNPPSIYGDRVILDYNDLFYIFVVANLDGKTDITCPLTMFKPTKKYRDKIIKQNYIYKMQN